MTLTVTEKGYSRRPDTGGLDTSAPGVVADLAATAGTDADLVTVIGRLTASLAARFRTSGAPIDVVSCDNTATNGAALARVVRGFVEATAWPDREAVLDWLATSVGFPDTIVDRIVPATIARDRDAGPAALGVRDEMAVIGEPYRQWVLQDAFVADRPRWELDGALVVPNVAPYQLMKLRLLNGRIRRWPTSARPRAARRWPRSWQPSGGNGWCAASVRRSPRPCRSGRTRARTPHGTLTTWSTGSATPRWPTCCARSARTDP